jgi:hypothetical protein
MPEPAAIVTQVALDTEIGEWQESGVLKVKKEIPAYCWLPPRTGCPDGLLGSPGC